MIAEIFQHTSLYSEVIAAQPPRRDLPTSSDDTIGLRWLERQRVRNQVLGNQGYKTLKKVLNLFFIGTAHLHRSAIGQNQVVLTIHVRTDLSNHVEVNDGASMYPLKS